MDYSINYDYTLVESPFKIRPGTICTVEITYSSHDTISWDSATTLTTTIAGFVVAESIKSETEIPIENITISYSGDNSIITILPIDNGILSLEVYYYNKETVTATSRSAFSSDYITNYKEYILVDGVVVPKTIVTYSFPSGAHEIVAVNVIENITNNGIDNFGDLEITLTNQGLLECGDYQVNILRKGKEKVLLPLDFDGPYLMIENGQKVVEIGNQEWQTGYNEARGLLVYNTNVLITTNYALCVFDIYSDFSTPFLADVRVIGNDIAYFSDDTIGITSGSSILKYHLRHDHVLIDKDNKRLYFREKDPRIDITVR